MIGPSYSSVWLPAFDWVRRGDVKPLTELALAHADELRSARVPAGPGQPYGRRVLLADAGGEIMLAAWRPGSTCAPHDHGDARGVVVVLEGAFTEGVYALGPAGLGAVARRTVSAGEVLRVERGIVHDMRAHGEGTTLHVYVPGVHAMNVYDRDARATLRVADDCGAWVPEDASQVLARVPWGSGGAR